MSFSSDFEGTFPQLEVLLTNNTLCVFDTYFALYSVNCKTYENLSRYGVVSTIH